MRAFVTGGAGFLGGQLVKKLEDMFKTVISPSSSDCDLTCDRSLDKYNELSFDYIFHLAAWTQAGDFCLHHMGEQWLINQKINTNVISWWANNQPQAKLIFIGTSCAYAEDKKLKEDNYMKGEPTPSLYTYAMTKRMLLQGARAMSDQFNLEWVCFVPSTLYGSGYHTDGRQLHFIFDLIKKILRGKFLNEAVVLWGDGNQRRELVLVDDFVSNMLELSPVVKNEVINIGGGEDYSIKQFAEMICDIVDYDVEKIVFDTSRYVGAQSKLLDVERIQKISPNFRESLTPIKEGLGSVVREFIELKLF